MTTDITEKGLETLIMLHMTGKLDVRAAAEVLPEAPRESTEPAPLKQRLKMKPFQRQRSNSMSNRSTPRLTTLNQSIQFHLRGKMLLLLDDRLRILSPWRREVLTSVEGAGGENTIQDTDVATGV